MKKELNKLADLSAVNSNTLRILNDKLKIQTVDQLNAYSPMMVHHMYPESDKTELYNLWKSVKESAPAAEMDTIKSLNTGGDEFNHAFIRSHLPVWDSKIDDQGVNGSCTAFAMTTLLEYYASIMGKHGIRFSRAFTYIFCNEWEGKHIPWWSPFGVFPYNDWGVWPDTVGRMFVNFGCCLNNDLPYNSNHHYYNSSQNPVKLIQDPAHPYNPSRLLPLAAPFAAKNLQIAMTYPLNPFDWVTTKIDNYLRKGYPSVYAFNTPTNMGGDGSGVIPRADGNSGTGHSILIIGKLNNYTPPGHATGNWYIFRNSWSGYGVNHPLSEYRNMGCGLIHEHDVYWRTIQALHVSW